MNKWICLALAITMMTACSDDDTSDSNNGANNGSTNNGANNGSSGPWQASIDGNVIEGMSAQIVTSTAPDFLYISLAPAAGAFSVLEFELDGADYATTGTVAATTAKISGGTYVPNCEFTRGETSTMNVTIDSITEPAPGLAVASSKGSFEGTLVCEGGEPFAVSGSWDF